MNDISTPQPETTSPTLTARKVFYIEDDEFIGSMIEMHLKKNNFEVVRFLRGDTAIDTLKHDIPDLVLLDLYLPEVGGIAVLQAIKSDERTKHIPVLVVSNTDQTEDRGQVEKLGGIFLIKAMVFPEDIVKEVLRALEAPKK